LYNRTATFTGDGSFQINSKITGAGNVVINMGTSSGTVVYDSANSYSGYTHVQRGTLLLASPEDGDNGIVGDLIIGGGGGEAVVTKRTSDNRALIGDNVKITLNQGGRLEFNRSSGWYGDSIERFGELVINGGTLLNASQSYLPTVALIGSLTLQFDGVIDLGNWMSVLVDNVGQSAWNPNAILTIKNWSPLEPVYMGNITAQQLSQIRFETDNGLVTAGQLCDFIVPSTVVPEASSFLFVPLLAVIAVWPEIRRRFRSRQS
jgi:autotransporter-associated beta strand protein